MKEGRTSNSGAPGGSTTVTASSSGEIVGVPWTGAPGITETVDQKIEALKHHRSQVQSPDEIETFVRERFKQIAQDQPYEYSESFHILRTNVV